MLSSLEYHRRRICTIYVHHLLSVSIVFSEKAMLVVGCEYVQVFGVLDDCRGIEGFEVEMIMLD